MISRERMVEIIRGGGSVKVGGRIISKLDQLPGVAELAGDDTAAQDLARAELDAQIAALEAQRQVLDARRAAAGTSSTSEQQPAGAGQTSQQPAGASQTSQQPAGTTSQPTAGQTSSTSTTPDTSTSRRGRRPSGSGADDD